jgi:hypothetical protein
MDPNLPQGHPSVVESPEHGKICAKNRLMIIIAKWEGHMTALSVHSHGNRSMEHQSKELQKGFIGIRASTDTSYVSENGVPPLVIKDSMKIKPTSVVALTKPVTVYYDSRTYNQAQLEFASVLRLLKAQEKYWQEGLNSLHEPRTSKSGATVEGYKSN